jgi:hypothetical protein
MSNCAPAARSPEALSNSVTTEIGVLRDLFLMFEETWVEGQRRATEINSDAGELRASARRARRKVARARRGRLTSDATRPAARQRERGEDIFTRSWMPSR